MMFSCPLGKYQYIRLPFGTTLVSDMFQKKKKCNIFGMADGTLIVRFDAGGRQIMTKD